MVPPLWATVNERDWRGDDIPPEMITEVKPGAFYGWPDCLVVGGKAIPDDRFEKGARGAGWALALLGLFIPVAHFILVPTFLTAGIVMAVERSREERRLTPAAPEQTA